MALPPFSERFFAYSSPGTWFYYTVPASRRAVLRSITITHAGDVSGLVYFTVAGTLMVRLPIPASEHTNRVLDLRQVAYAGEQFGVHLTQGDGHVLASGYLLHELPIGGGAAGSQGPGPPPPWFVA